MSAKAIWPLSLWLPSCPATSPAASLSYKRAHAHARPPLRDRRILASTGVSGTDSIPISFRCACTSDPPSEARTVARRPADPRWPGASPSTFVMRGVCVCVSLAMLAQAIFV